MSARPTGTVTFLFTDIEGSTQLWEEHPVAMRSALARHDVLLRAAVDGADGWVFSTGGDGLAAVFARAGDAVEAAVAAQVALAAEGWPEPVVLRVRMGVHTGEAEERDGDYFGPAVNRAARLMATAPGGHVVVSLPTSDIVRSGLRDGLALIDLGERELRSLSRPERVFELTWPGGDAPAAFTSRVSVGYLPRSTRSLIGRDALIESLDGLLAECRLVTLTGVGGAGKTSLALAVARRVGDRFGDGVWFCDLTAVLQPGEVMAVVAETLGLRPQAGVAVAEAVLRALSHQRCLLVLDNCEHVLDAAAGLADDVGRRCPDATILATSREGLGVPGEQLVAVRPLDTIDAVRLFRARAGDHHGGFDPTDADEVLVAELCERLDGLPLAIELAAARARSMPLADLCGRLGERFRLLRGQRRSADRHQTLRAMVAWSYDLLVEEERLLFDRLSVFTGGFSLAAAEAICADDRLDTVDVDELVVALVEKSMIVADPEGGYRLLETLRQFGEEQLQATSDPDGFRDAHLEYFAAFAVTCHDGLQGENQVMWLHRMRADWANLRAAFGWATTVGDVTAAATVAVQLIWAAFWHGETEPYTWIQDVAAMVGADTNPMWHHILAGRAWVAWESGQLDDAFALGLQALEAQPAGEATIDYLAEFSIISAVYMADQHLVDDYSDRLMKRVRVDTRGVYEAWHTVTVGLIHLLRRERVEEALRLARRAHDLAVGVGNPNMIAWALNLEGGALQALGDPTAADVFERGFLVAQQSCSTLAATLCRQGLTRELLQQSRFIEAVPLVLEDLQANRRRAVWLHQTLLQVGLVLVELDKPETAATLYGAIDRPALLQTPQWAEIVDDLHRKLVGALDDDTLAELTVAGEHLQPQQVAVVAETALTGLLPG